MAIMIRKMCKILRIAILMLNMLFCDAIQLKCVLTVSRSKNEKDEKSQIY